MSNKILGEAFKVIETVAPAIASALGSPVSGIGASFLVSLLAKAFGLEPDNHEQLAQKILNDPCACDKLKELNDNFVSSIDVTVKANFDHDKK